MVYRMLALNIDGTVLKSNGRMDRDTKQAVQFAKDKGVYVTLVTSRHFSSARKVARALKIDGYLVTHYGAFVSEDTKEPIVDERLTENFVYSLVSILEHFDCHTRLVHENFSLSNKMKTSSNMIARTAMNSTDPLFYPMQFVETLSDKLIDEPVSVPHIDIYPSSYGEQERIASTLKEELEGIDVIVKADGRISVVPAGVSKEKGVRLLGEHLGISPAEMVVIGDAEDDQGMIEMAGLGVAMGNAPASVKKAADWVTRSNDQQGVSYMVKELFRKQFQLKKVKEKFNL
ncbi:Cof-type HAD-IIB family hydrolase [Bacillus marinisedimentorum]|uniref:Cof-type HAD-IIB family hydrolase n=1 Tax=Bacillus marinisedimentorum TaxID=1821260 RepID=UPI0007E28F52|nr:Cof-type HAD-IIB family hydrolase [Bacillus marinisedimentorum]